MGWGSIGENTEKVMISKYEKFDGQNKWKGKNEIS